MPTIGFYFQRPDLERARRARAWAAFYIARGVGIFRAGELGRRKAAGATGWPPTE